MERKSVKEMGQNFSPFVGKKISRARNNEETERFRLPNNFILVFAIEPIFCLCEPILVRNIMLKYFFDIFTRFLSMGHLSLLAVV